MRFFAVIFTILVSIVGSNFVAPEKVSAQATSTTDTVYTCPDGTTKYYDPADKKNCPKVVTGITQADITMWINWANSALGTFSRDGGALYKADFATLANAVLTIYQNRVDVTPTQVMGYILTGIPDTDLTANQKTPLYLKGMYGLTATATDRNMAAKAELALVNILGNVSAYETQLNQQAINNPNAVQDQLTYSTNLNNATLAAQKSIDKKIDENAKTCSIVLKFNLGDCVDLFVSWIITHTLLAAAGWLLWVTATVMNYAISVGILQFADWAPDSLYPIWLVIRQITSLFVVFAGLWLGFMYIIDRGDQFKKYIPTVVMFALFINFSYPLTRTVIDVSNIISLNIYASTVGASTLDAKLTPITSEKTAGAMIMNKLGLMGMIDYATGDASKTAGSLNAINSIAPALLAVVFVLYAAWIFFIISALIITRTAVLVFLIIASPLLFVDKIIPKLGDEAVKLRGIFVEMILVGPVFAIMLALTLKFLEVFKAGPLSSTGAIGASSGDSAITMFFNMLMMLIMLHIMFKVTKATSGKIGQAVAGVASSVGGLAVGGAFGGVAMLGRKGIGSLARKAQVAGVGDGSGWMAKDNMLSRAAFHATGAVANATFDGRNSSAVKWGASKMGIGGMGTGGKLGYHAENEAHRTELRERQNFGRSALRSEESRKKEEFLALETESEREQYLSKNVTNDKQRESLKKEARDKALAKYKGFDTDTKEGRDAQEKFFNEQGAETQARLREYSEKVEREKTEKIASKNEHKETTEVLKSLAEELKLSRTQAKATGTTPGVVATAAVNQAVNNNVASPNRAPTPPPTAKPAGYPANPKGELTLETASEATARVNKMNGTETTRATTSQESHVLDTVPF